MLEREEPPSILLVEESPTDRVLLERALRNCVTVALDADAALQAAQRRSFAAVLLSDALTRGGALDLLRDLRAAVGETPIVFMSEAADEALGAAARAAGAAAWVVKDPGYEDAVSSLVAAVTGHGIAPSEPDVATAPSAACDVLVIELDGHRYGVRAADVETVARVVTIAPLPGAPPDVEGCIVYRGRVITVLDLRARLGLQRKPIEETQHLVLVRADARLLAIRVDRATDVVHVENGVRCPDAVDSRGGGILGVAEMPDHVPLVVYDVGAFARAPSVRAPT
jgi:chemotaxis signal transduction protein